MNPSLSLDSYESFTAHLEDREFFGQKLGLERIRRVLSRLGDPQDRFSSIHIAGTNGKGSTAVMIASILAEAVRLSGAGHRVGLYTSPHLVDFCERIRIGDRLISPDEVIALAREVRAVEEEPLTFFELATAIAFLHFARQKVDIAVLETGLGGRLDATNVVSPLLSVITSIALDHTQHLGSTLREIAFEKAGIIKPGVPVVTGELSAEAARVIGQIALEREAPLFEGAAETTVGLGSLRIGLAGAHQRQNAAIAVRVVELLRDRYSFTTPDEAVRTGLAKVSWPGRLETISESPWVILDGAHNPAAMQAVREFLEERRAGRRVKLLFGAMADKDLTGLLAAIAPVADEFFLTAPRLKRAADPRLLADLAAPLGKPVTVIDGVEASVRTALERLRRDEVLLVTGSLFVVGEARNFLKLSGS